MDKVSSPHIETEVITVDDGLYDVDLTIEHAVGRLPTDIRSDYELIYRWFQEGGDRAESRLLGQRLPDVSIPHAAQRGIHKPSKQEYAVSITVSENDFYQRDRKPITLADGTWILVYSAQINNKGDKPTDDTYNQSLIKCLTDGIPVGVFLPAGHNLYRRYLAFVEKYDPFDNTFTLHGPVTSQTAGSFISHAREIEPSLFEGKDAGIDVTRDSRTYEEIRSIQRKGQQRFRSQLVSVFNDTCIISDCDVDDALQAAHIFPYRGPHTNAIENGLLLRADLHLLYDAKLLSINPEYQGVEVARTIDYPEYRRFDGKHIRLPKAGNPDERNRLLDIHYREFLQKY